ncbi:MAG: hypothetical protein Q8P24_21635 [Desulfobacterales bacterium]|nr:hypothetical protein [Desulfobacterales bacterium]
MEDKKSEKVKTFIVIGLAVLMVVLAYFRFFHGKSKTRVTPRPPAPVSATSALPTVAVNVPATPGSSHLTGKMPDKPLSMNIRDIFSPMTAFIPLETKKEKADPDTKTQEPPKPLTQLKLMGTIVEGENPMAIINDQFVRPGDQIGGYEVTKIDKSSVHLRVIGQPEIQKVLDFSE